MIAGFAAAILWAIGSTVIGFIHEKDVNSRVMQAFRLPITLLFLFIVTLFTDDWLWTNNVSTLTWFFLLISGVIGLALGDIFLFSAYRSIGPRLGMLLMVCAPIISAVLAWLFIGEGSTMVQMIGMGITLGGVAWVVVSDQSSESKMPLIGDGSNYKLGILFGVLAAVGQGSGAFLTRLAFETDDISALNATLIRMIGGLAGIWLILLLNRQLFQSYRVLWREKRASGLLLITVFLGPFLGVWLSSIAFKTIHLGVASTILALPPVLMIPIGRYVFKEEIKWQSVVGTIVAMVGAAVLFLL